MTTAPYRKAALCRETTSTAGTGTVNLDLGAKPRHQTIVAGLLTAYGDTTPGDQAQGPYTLLSGDGLGWETGVGTVTLGTPSTFSRDEVKSSSAGGTTHISLVGVSEIYIYTEAMQGFFNNLIVRNAGGSIISSENYIGGVSGSYGRFDARSAEGTEAAPTYPLNGNLLGGYTFSGWNENINDWSVAGQILAEAAEDWSAGSHASRMKIGVNASGAAVDEWDGTYNTDFALSGSNLIATTLTGSIVDTIIGTALNSSGKKYFELHITTSASDVSFGLAEPAHVNSRVIGDLSPSGGGGTAKSVAFKVFSNVTRSFFVGGVETASGMSTGPGLVNKWLGFAVDLDTGYILVRDCSAPTVWYGNNSAAGDPASISTHGFPFTPFGTALALAFTSNQNAVGETTTMNAGGSAFQAAPPAGYGPWATGDAFSSLVFWEDGGLSCGGLTSQGIGTLNLHSIYVDDVLVADGGSGGPTFAGLTDVTISSAATNDFVAWSGSAWTNRTVTATTALLNAFVGDSGSGGTKGLVPAPGAGDAAAGKFLKADGTFAVPAGSGLSTSLTSAHIFVGNGSNIATDVAVSGDVTLNNAGAYTIVSNAVTNAKMAQMAAHTFKGNNTGSTADSLDLSVTQLTAELNAVVGDSGSGGTKGLVPAPAAGDAAAGKFLGAGGGYSIPAGTSAIISLGELTASSSASLAWSGLTGNKWRLIGHLLKPATASTTLAIQYGTGAGPTIHSTGYYSGGRYNGITVVAASDWQSNNAAAWIAPIAQDDTQGGASFDLTITSDNVSAVIIQGTLTQYRKSDGHTFGMNIFGVVGITAQLTAIAITEISGNIASGKASLYSISG
jgi:hypothetical protein